MILGINTQQPRIPQQKADEMDRRLLIESDFTEVDQHLFPGRGVEYMVINAPVFCPGIDLTGFLQIVNVVPKGLLVAGEILQIAVFDEFLFQKIVNRRNAELVPAVILQDRDNRLPERGHIKRLVFGEFCARILRNDIHVVVLGDRGAAGWFQTLLLIISQDLGFGVAAKF